MKKTGPAKGGRIWDRMNRMNNGCGKENPLFILFILSKLFSLRWRLFPGSPSCPRP
jgi:hypothetical protein